MQSLLPWWQWIVHGRGWNLGATLVIKHIDLQRLIEEPWDAISISASKKAKHHTKQSFHAWKWDPLHLEKARCELEPSNHRHNSRIGAVCSVSQWLQCLHRCHCRCCYNCCHHIHSRCLHCDHHMWVCCDPGLLRMSLGYLRWKCWVIDTKGRVICLVSSAPWTQWSPVKQTANKCQPR